MGNELLKEEKTNQKEEKENLDHAEVEAKKTDKGLEFIPTAPEYTGEIDACAWPKYNQDGKIISLVVQIGGKKGIRFKLTKHFL